MTDMCQLTVWKKIKFVVCCCCCCYYYYYYTLPPQQVSVVSETRWSGGTPTPLLTPPVDRKPSRWVSFPPPGWDKPIGAPWGAQEVPCCGARIICAKLARGGLEKCLGFFSCRLGFGWVNSVEAHALGC